MKTGLWSILFHMLKHIASSNKGKRQMVSTMPVVIQGNVSITAEFEEAPKYSVTITPGSNMTKTTDSGAASQTDLSGAMEDVVYTANDGYYFPTDYSVTAVNGISVTRNSYTQITVSGTPTADAAISLTAPTAKTKPDAPTTAASVDCTTADNNDGKLTGVTTAMEYQKSGATSWTAGTGSDITGLVPGTYYVRVKATDTTTASDNQTLTVAPTYTVTYYSTTSVKNGEHTVGDGKDTVISVSRTPDNEKAYSLYTGSTTDGNAIPAWGHTTAEGSLILTLKASYLDTLSVGKHTVKVNFQDGSAEATLTIKPAPTPPKTGDSNHPALWIALILLGLSGMAMLVLQKHPKRK